MPPSADKSTTRWVWLRRADQTFVMVVVACFLLVAAGHWTYRVQHRKDLIEIDKAPPLQATFEVDVNSADWPELVQLPGVGETTARKIVEVRDADGRFVSLDDLQRRVHGVGPRLVAEIAPFISPFPDVETDAQQARVTAKQQR